MDEAAVRRVWNDNADGWTEMSRAGYDVFRDVINTPAFLRMLPDIVDRRGLDIGCGEGHNTRRLARLGADMSGIDIANRFVAHARRHEYNEPLGIDYQIASGTALPFADRAFDFATGFMSFQDMPNQHLAFAEAHRVLRPGGFLQFSITHPCFQTPRFAWVLDEVGRKVAVEAGDYFRDGTTRTDHWTFTSAPAEMKSRFAPFATPYFEHTLAGWVQMIHDAGFTIEALAEPRPDDQALETNPELAHATVIALFLIVRCHKAETLGYVPNVSG